MKKSEKYFSLTLVIITFIMSNMVLLNQQSNQSPKKQNQAKKESTIKISKPKSKTLTASERRNKIINRYINNMTLEEKVGQMMLSRVPEQNAIEQIKKYHLGGYILFDRDFKGKNIQQVKKVTDQYQKASHIPMLMATDEEGGSVSRLTTAGYGTFLSPQDLYRQGGFELIQQDINSKSQLMRQLGLNAAMAPDADLATSPTSFIYPRTFGGDLSLTKEYVALAVQAFQNNHIVSTLKHFPGYGDQGDSHQMIIRDPRTKEELAPGLQPFASGIQVGADSVLVEHNIVEAYDKKLPASLSPKVHQVLRKDLGFKGIIMTDDMDMKGLSEFMSQKEAAIQAVRAGNDMIISSSYRQQIPAIIQAVKKNQLSEKQIDGSCRRILTVKYKLGLLN